jgi:hypothetical protein
LTKKKAIHPLPLAGLQAYSVNDPFLFEDTLILIQYRS